MDHLLSKEKELLKVAYKNKTRSFYLVFRNREILEREKMIFENWILIT